MGEGIKNKNTISPLTQGEGKGEGIKHTRHSRESGSRKTSEANPQDINKVFSKEQLIWLNKIKDQIAQNAEMTEEDFNYNPFNQEGGLLKAKELFGKDLDNLLQELNGYLIA